MQRFRMVYHRKSHVSISLFTHKSLCEFAYQENTSDKWDIPLHSKREHNYFIPFHRKYGGDQEHNAICARRRMGRLDVIPSNLQRLSCILIGCIYYGMV